MDFVFFPLEFLFNIEKTNYLTHDRDTSAIKSVSYNHGFIGDQVLAWQVMLDWYAQKMHLICSMNCLRKTCSPGIPWFLGFLAGKIWEFAWNCLPMK